jgi:quercetin dioxygenase-like cupin family protein
MTKQSNSAENQALPEPWPGVLASALAAPALQPAVASAMKQRLMERVSADAGAAAPALRSVMRDDGWRNLAPKVQVKLLHDVTFSWLLKLLPGGRLPTHDHDDGAEECMVIEGKLFINGQQYSGGDYQVALPGTVHHEVRSDEGALVYLRSPSSRRKHLIPA